MNLSPLSPINQLIFEGIVKDTAKIDIKKTSIALSGQTYNLQAVCCYNLQGVWRILMHIT